MRTRRVSADHHQAPYRFSKIAQHSRGSGTVRANRRAMSAGARAIQLLDALRTPR